MHETQNGWTKESMIEHVKNNFKGKSFQGTQKEGSFKCLYRGPEGKKCAVGLFIPDDKYSPEMDGGDDNIFATLAIDVINRHQLETLMPLSTKGMGVFQNAHDTMNNSGNLNLEQETNILLEWINENVK